MRIPFTQIRWPRGEDPFTRREALALSASVILLVAGATAAFITYTTTVKAGLAARVNGEPITERELKRVLADPSVQRQAQQAKDVRRIMTVSLQGRAGENRAAAPQSEELERVALRKLILRRLLLQEAERRGLMASAKELEAGLELLKQRFPDAQAFDGWRAANELDDASLREVLRTEILLPRVSAALVQDTSLPEGELRAYYEAHQAELKVAETFRLQVIAVGDKASADDILKALKKKRADFAQLARERSKGWRAAQGGDVGWTSTEKLPPPLRSALGKVKVGEIRGPLQVGAQFIIVRLRDQRPARLKSFEEAKPEIEQRLLRGKQREIVMAWLSAQEKKSKIEIFR